MKREIKFRVWDGKEYHYEIELGDGDDGCFSFGYIDDPEFFIEQYTGLKDHEGKEIYEGDIVGLGDMISEVKFGEYISEEGYRAYGFYISWTGFCWDLIQYTYFPEGYEDVFKVIGNIHENPELLNNL